MNENTETKHNGHTVRPIWKDPVQDALNAVVCELADSSRVRVDMLAPELFRVRRTRAEVWTESGMNRYGIIKRFDVQNSWFSVNGNTITTAAFVLEIGNDGTVSVKSKVSAADMKITTELTDTGCNIAFPLTKSERIYGLGDVSRENIQRRPGRYEMFVKNVNSYIPIPMTIAHGGWGMLLNTTWRNYFDVGMADKDVMRCEVPVGDLDFYYFVGKDYRSLLDTYTRLTGRPQLLPSFAYGFAYVCNQYVDQFELMNEATWFTKLGMPIDIIGLEPDWMDSHYDMTTRKQWSKVRFNAFPYWAPTGSHLFSHALTRMGLNLSLWMCTDYDFFPYEEQCAAGLAKERGEKIDIADGVPEEWRDPNIEKTEMKKVGAVRPTSCFTWDRTCAWNVIDKKFAEEAKYPEGTLPWFKHLEKFCDQGARCWKLDGSLQVCQSDMHPGKVYGNGMHVDEAHNLYPVVYGKQMARGYENYTDRRSMVYSAGGYAGVQAYVATWAGDTGGGEKTLVSTLNLGMSGHPNQSCDMTISSKVRMHYGFLAPWSQANDWDSFHRPWCEGEEAEASFRHYAALRYSLFPYIYGTAVNAARTGYPIARSLAFVAPDVPEYDNCKTTYMLGDSLLVSVFSDVTDIPAGTWYDWRTGNRIVGPRKEAWDQNGLWGGGLFVKEGAIIPRWENKMHLTKGWDKNVTFNVWPLVEGESSYVWYEDDGDSLKYRDGVFTETPVSCKVENGYCTFAIGKRTGTFDGMPSSHYVKLRIRLDKRPVVQYGTYDWRTKMFEIDLGDVDPDVGTEFKFQLLDPSSRTHTGKTLRECSWMWGHDTGAYDAPGNCYNIPVSEKISMPDACRALGVPNCCAVRWRPSDDEYIEAFRKMDRFSWVLGSAYNNAYNYLKEHDFMLVDEMQNFTGFDLDDIFINHPPVKAVDCEGREIRVVPSSPSYAELVALKDRIGRNPSMQRLELRAVLYVRQIRPEIKPILDLVDTVLFWTWDGVDISKLRSNFETYRKFLPDKPTLLGIYMWDFGGCKPLSAEAMKTQLAFALEKFKAGEIKGVIFHCTPLVNKNLESVELCRQWLQENGDIPVA